MITGSASKGKYSLYYYYHCLASCGFRHRADDANELFVKELRKYVSHPAVVDLSKMIIAKAYQIQFKRKQSGSKQIIEEIDKLNIKLSKARELLLNDAIDAGDYKDIKAQCESRIAQLEAQLAEQTNVTSMAKIERQLDKIINTLTKIDIMFEEGTVTEKRNIISSIYAENIDFDGLQYRTSRLNSVVSCIYQINNNLYQIKNRKDDDFFRLSGDVASPRIELGSKV